MQVKFVNNNMSQKIPDSAPIQQPPITHWPELGPVSARYCITQCVKLIAGVKMSLVAGPK